MSLLQLPGTLWNGNGALGEASTPRAVFGGLLGREAGEGKKPTPEPSCPLPGPKYPGHSLHTPVQEERAPGSIPEKANSQRGQYQSVPKGPTPWKELPLPQHPQAPYLCIPAPGPGARGSPGSSPWVQCQQQGAGRGLAGAGPLAARPARRLGTATMHNVPFERALARRGRRARPQGRAWAGLTASLRCAKAFRDIESHHGPNAAEASTDPCPQVPHLCLISPSRDDGPTMPWMGCASA